MASKTNVVSFCDLYSFVDSKALNPEALWPQDHKRKRRASLKPTFSQQKPKTQSKLLQSALMKIRYEQQQFQQDVLSDMYSQQSSSFAFSRQNTPGNLQVPKKKHNKHKTTTSQLFEIESQGQNDQHHRTDDHLKQLILYPNFVGLSELLYSEATGRDRKISNNLIHSWKDCLLPEDKHQIYGSRAPYTFSRVFPINQLEKGFSQIYGTGKKRCLKIGQQSLLIHTMSKYLQKCTHQVTKIARKDYDIIADILLAAKLQQLQNLPICMRQVELLWRILATQWRYSGKLDGSNRMLENALVNGRSNFVDLRKENRVTAFLMRNSNLGRSQE